MPTNESLRPFFEIIEKGDNYFMVVQLVRKEIVALVAAIVFALLFFFPLWVSGIIDNGDWHVHWFRLSGFAQSLSEGLLRPLWHSNANANYGAPTFLFYPPLAYYLASVPVLLGIDITSAWLITYLAIVVLATIGGFVLFRRWVSRVAAVAMALGFSLSPPLVLLLYQFHMPAYALALALMPWFIESILNSGQSQIKKMVFVAATTSLLIVAHPLVAMQAALIAVILLVGFMGTKRFSDVVSSVAGGVLGTILSSPYWFPMIRFREFVHWEYLLNPAWSWENNVLFIRPDRSTGAFHDHRLLFELLSVFVLVLSLAAFHLSRRCGYEQRALSLTIIAGSLLVFIIMTPWGTWLVNLLSPLAYLQFSWRWLGLQWILMLILWAICFGGFQPAHRDSASRQESGRLQLGIGSSAIVLVLVSSIAITGSFGNIKSLGIRDVHVTEAAAERAIRDEFWPTIEMRPRILGNQVGANLNQDPMPSVWVKRGDIQILSHDQGQYWIKIEYLAGSPGSVRLRHFNFPGWVARRYQNSEVVEVTIESEPGSGAMLIDLPPGRATLRLEFTGLGFWSLFLGNF